MENGGWDVFPVLGMCIGQGKKNNFPDTLQEFCLFVKETHFEKHLFAKCLVR